MSKASSLYRCLSKTMFSASELLELLNKEICETAARGMFVTMLVGIYDSLKKFLLFYLMQVMNHLLFILKIKNFINFT